MFSKNLIVALLLCQVEIGLSFGDVKIVKASGDVKVRRGVEESWHPVSSGASLEEIDSILTGENGRAILEVQDGRSFTLGNNSVLDIADLRRISERELFLYLMSRKIDQLDKREGKTKLRIGNVNVVHGAPKADVAENDESEKQFREWIRERNGAKALYLQKFTTNAILKMNKILTRYPGITDCGEIHYYIGQSFESLKKPGQALEAYGKVLERSRVAGCDDPDNIWARSAAEAARRLSQ